MYPPVVACFAWRPTFSGRLAPADARLAWRPVRIVIRLVDLEAELADPMERASGIGKLKELAFNRFAGMFGS